MVIWYLAANVDQIERQQEPETRKNKATVIVLLWSETLELVPSSDHKD